MGTTTSTTKLSELNEIVLNAMVENNMACNQEGLMTQDACLSGVTIGFYQSQTGMMSATCQMDTTAVAKIQASVTAKIMQKASADSKMLMPATSTNKTEYEVQNIVEANLTVKNIAEINNNLTMIQTLDECKGATVSIGIIQKQSMDQQLEAVSDVLIKTSLYEDLYGKSQSDTYSSATLIGFGVMLLLMIIIVVALIYGAKVAMDPGVQQTGMKMAMM